MTTTSIRTDGVVIYEPAVHLARAFHGGGIVVWCSDVGFPTVPYRQAVMEAIFATCEACLVARTEASSKVGVKP